MAVEIAPRAGRGAAKADFRRSFNNHDCLRIRRSLTDSEPEPDSESVSPSNGHAGSVAQPAVPGPGSAPYRDSPNAHPRGPIAARAGLAVIS